MAEFRKTPNYTKNKRIIPKGIILHHTAGAFTGSVEWCLNPKSQVSYHAIVNTNGEVYELAEDWQRCWHAGVSEFRGRKDCNSFMLGVALTGDTYTRALTISKVEAIVDWCKDKMKKWNISKDNVVTHREVAPLRKRDISPEAEKKIKDKL